MRSVHPHARGEHTPTRWVVGFRRGSSPRTWGTRARHGDHMRKLRFIPTHVGNTSRRCGKIAQRSVHPHARGEHDSRSSLPLLVFGSSPRTWGTPNIGEHSLLASRFIPTHVGNTAGIPSINSDATVHPHARGEHLRMAPRQARPLRFIPTHVGNTRSWEYPAIITTVHPHARGEHGSPVNSQKGHDGSSPRTWGTPGKPRWGSRGIRFIPTHVGNTPRSCRRDVSGAVHPHARGEHADVYKSHGYTRGSSPRTWGTPNRDFQIPRLVRFIPTHVGNTHHSFTQLLYSPVHPHARGEHISSTLNVFLDAGSSPRTWGTHKACVLAATGVRFIPTHVGNTRPGRQVATCAAVHPHARGEHPPLPSKGNQTNRFIPTHVGNTCRKSGNGEARSVHPHARGEHGSIRLGHDRVPGSSPRTWGTRPVSGCADAGPRFIPTHVGNTLTTAVNLTIISVHPHARGEH